MPSNEARPARLLHCQCDYSAAHHVHCTCMTLYSATTALRIKLSTLRLFQNTFSAIPPTFCPLQCFSPMLTDAAPPSCTTLGRDWRRSCHSVPVVVSFARQEKKNNALKPNSDSTLWCKWVLLSAFSPFLLSHQVHCQIFGCTSPPTCVSAETTWSCHSWK